MRIISIFLVSLVLANSRSSSGMAIIKDVVSEPESSLDCSSAESSQTPEAANVRSKNPETDPLNDVAKPQLPEDLVQPHSPSAIISKSRRCARSQILGSQDPILSLARRDVTERHIQQCETCKNKPLCKKYKMCNTCKIFCDNISTTTASTMQDNIPTVRPDGETQITVVTATETAAPIENIVVGSRFKALEEASPPRYYSLASVEPGVLMRLLSRVFNIPENFDKFVILGKKRGSIEEENDSDISIIDLAQAFGNEKKITASVEKSGEVRMDLVEKLDERLGEVDESKTNNVVEQVLDEETNNVGLTQESTISPETNTRCNLDKAVDDLIDIMPQRSKPESYSEVKPQTQIVESQESSEEIKNPPVIQDNFNMVGRNVEDGYADDNEEARLRENSDRPNLVSKNLDDGFIDDNEEARPSVVSEVKVPKNKPLPIPKQIDPVVNPVGDAQEVLKVSDNTREIPASENQVAATDNLEKNVLETVKDSLKSVPMAQNIVDTVDKSLRQNPEIGPQEFENFPVQEQEPQPIFVERTKPSQANSDNVMKVIKAPQRETVGETLDPQQFATQTDVLQPTTSQLAPSTIPPNIVEMAPQLENRGTFSNSENPQEKSTYFGALVPANEESSARVKKLYYVGQDINLPLKMFQDKNGVMKLRVDTDALCNCKNRNCTRPHLDDRLVEDDVQAAVPELKVRYGDNDLMESFVDAIHTQGENSEKFKRSAKIDEITVENQSNEEMFQTDRYDKEERKLENTIKKLRNNFENVDSKNKELLNKGTVALYKQIETTKDIGKMITLASDLLSWMKDLATEHLKA